MAAGRKHLVVAEMTTIAEIDGQPVGVVLGLLDYNPRIKKIDYEPTEATEETNR